MKGLVLTLAILVTISVSSAQTGFKQSFAQLSATPFGALMMSTIQINLANSQDLKPVADLVDQLLNQLTLEQIQSDQINNSNQAVCNENNESFSNQVKLIKTSIENLETSIQLTQDRIQSDTAGLEQANSDRYKVSSSIANGKGSREESHQRWVQNDQLLTEQIAALEEATKLVDHLTHGVKFNQVKVRYEKAMTRLTSSSSKNPSLFKPLVSSLAQIATVINPSDTSKILTLLINLRTAMIQTKEDSDSSEQSSADSWETVLKSLQENLQQYDALKSKYSSSLAQLGESLKQSETSLGNYKRALENMVFQQADQKTLCDKQIQEYAKNTAENNKSTSVLSELKKHLEESDYSSFMQFIR